MSTDIHSAKPSDPCLQQRANELFDELRQDVCRHTDRLFLGLMIVQWLLGIALAAFYSPQTWIGESSFVHIHLWFAIFFGGLISLPAIYLAIFQPGKTLTRHVVAISQGCWTAFLIHLTGGRIETHFHAFGSLAFLVFYRDWRVLVTASLVISLDHAVRGSLWPLSVYGVNVDSTFRFIEHGLWIVFIDIFLVNSCFRHHQEAKSICERRAQLEITNQQIEKRIEDRTRELEQAHKTLEEEYQERERLHSELVTTSRKAGMADVATGILHNVGNVLNTIGVSAQTLCDTVKKSPVDRLQKASKIVDENKHNLANFVTEDPRGTLLPKMMTQISDRLVEDQELELQEIDILLNSLEHIQEIVKTQQQVARHCREVNEEINLGEIIDEAMRLGRSNRLAQNIQTEINLPELQTFFVDKHKLLQILINLIGNAEQAVVCARNPKILIEVQDLQSDVKVTVTDNGVGINSKNLEKIFEHGFTTKPDGNGFGLHASAIDAQSLGGSLTAKSPGINKGATFELLIPYCQQKPDTNPSNQTQNKESLEVLA